MEHILRFLVLIALTLGAVVFSMWFFNRVPPLPSGNGATAWFSVKDRISGPILYYRDENDEVIARIDCVGSSVSMPLLETTRPFNRILSLETPLARSWTAGREVVVMIQATDGWRETPVIAMQDRLIIDPTDTEHGMVSMSVKGEVNLKIMANLTRGIVERSFAISNNDLQKSLDQQDKGCRRIYG
jgi:hypothetical protein